MPVTASAWIEPQIELSELFPKQNEDVHSTTLDGESVLLNLSTGRYYTLNGVGSLVWDQCTGTHSLDHILSAISERFDVACQQAQTDLVDLVIQLRQEGLLHCERR